MLKSREAFEAIQFVSYIASDNTVYYARRKARDDAARAAFLAELEKDDMDGIYIRDLIRGEVKPDEPRLR